VPEGRTLDQINAALLEDLGTAAERTRNHEGRSVRERFDQERAAFRPLPVEPFEVRRFQSVSISSKATIQIEGATYSVPSSWARLSATAYIGVQDIRIICRGEVRLYAKARPGERVVRYRDYLSELRRKPQAVRQVAPQLMEELGEPWGQLWRLLLDTHGGREAARVVARLLGAVVKHGEQRVRDDLDAALSAGAPNLAALSRLLHATDEVDSVQVPETLAGYEVDSARATDYDWLIEGGIQ